MGKRGKAVRFLSLAMKVFLMDQHSKMLAERIEPGSEVVVLKNTLSFRNQKNEGAAYGLFKDNPKALAAFTTAAIAWFAGTVARVAAERGLTDGEKASLSCLAGGAMGNLADRARHGRVTDFIYVHAGKKAPVFNIADVFIFLGAVTFMYQQIFSRKK